MWKLVCLIYEALLNMETSNLLTYFVDTAENVFFYPKTFCQFYWCLMKKPDSERCFHGISNIYPSDDDTVCIRAADRTAGSDDCDISVD